MTFSLEKQNSHLVIIVPWHEPWYYTCASSIRLWEKKWEYLKWAAAQAFPSSHRKPPWAALERNLPAAISPLLVWFVSLQLARHNKELQAMLKPGGTYGEGDEALEFYAKHTAQIEVGAYVTTVVITFYF